MLAWAKANGATADQLNDAILEALQVQGATAEQLNDAWFEVLLGQGYTGALNDMLWQFWCVNGGSFGPLPILPIFAAQLVSSLTPETFVDPTYTFTRAGTTATVTDFEGLVKDTAANEARFVGARRVENLRVDDFSDWTFYTSGTGSPATLTSGQVDPDGGNTAYRLQCNLNGGISTGDRSTLFIGGSDSTSPKSLSVWLRSNTGVTQYCHFRTGNEGVGSFGEAVQITTDWQRFAVIDTGTFGDDYLGLRGSRSNGQDVLDILIWHPLKELTPGQTVQAPSEYVSKGVSEDHGSNADGVKYFNYENGNTVTTDVVTEAQGSAIADATLKGVLLEEARTNNCLYSADLSNAAWVASNITKSSDGIQLPDGTAGTAETLTASAGNGTLLQTITLVSAANTFSVYLQRKTGVGNIDITLDNGATWTTKVLTGVGTWDRVDIQGVAAANPAVGVRIVTNGDAVQMWGAQLETGAFATSYIPTVDAAATRNAESLSYSNTNFSDVEGSLAMTFTPSADTAQYVGGGARELLGVRASVGDVLSLASSSGKLSLNDGTTETNSATMPALVAGTALKLAGRWSALGSVYQLRQDDTNSNAAVFDGSMNKSAVMSVGYSGSRPNGTYKDVKTYDGYLSDEAFEALTV